MNNKISIIIPAYNAQKFIVNTLDSISESNHLYEVICVNDGSRDNTEQILDKYKEEHPSFPLQIINQNNQGQNVARYNGFVHSKGDYIFFVDADDLIAPKALDILSDKMDAYDCPDIISFSMKIIRENGELEKKQPNLIFDKEAVIHLEHNPNEYMQMLIGTRRMNILGLKIFKRQILEDSFVLQDILKIRMGEDGLLSCMCTERASRVLVLDQSLYIHRINHDSVSFEKFNNKQIEANSMIFDYLYNLNKKYDDLYEAELYNRYLELFFGDINNIVGCMHSIPKFIKSTINTNYFSYLYLKKSCFCSSAMKYILLKFYHLFYKLN